MPLLVGVTGGIGSGKTTACRIFELLGVPVYYADERSRSLANSDADIRGSIIELLGDEAYSAAGQNRSYIAAKVFNNPDLLKKLNAIVHPAVAADFLRWVREQSSPYVIKEAAILIESGSYRQLDKLIVVTAPEAIRLSRVVKRDMASAEHIRQRMANQITDAERLTYADFNIDNSGNTLLIPQILKTHDQIIHSFK